jgi:hypothetical protein
VSRERGAAESLDTVNPGVSGFATQPDGRERQVSGNRQITLIYRVAFEIGEGGSDLAP